MSATFSIEREPSWLIRSSAVKYLSQQGIVHRDIKPANVLLCEQEDAVKIADFGVARYGTSELTRTGTTVGSPAHMSPEQIRGRDVDGRSDLFSLGVVLYQALSGNHPFPGEDLTGLAYTIVHTSPIPLSQLIPDLPRGIDAFIERALAKEPEDRFADAAAFRRALQEMGAEPGGWLEAPSLRPVPRSEAAPEDELPAAAPMLFSIRDDDEATPRFGRAARAAAFALLVPLLAAWWWIASGKPESYIQLETRSAVRSGVLVVLVDGEAVISRPLGPPIATATRELPRIESFETMIPVAPGRHQLQVHVTDDHHASHERRSVLVEVEPGETEPVTLVTRDPQAGDAVVLQVDNELEP